MQRFGERGVFLIPLHNSMGVGRGESSKILSTEYILAEVGGAPTPPSFSQLSRGLTLRLRPSSSFEKKKAHKDNARA